MYTLSIGMWFLTLIRQFFFALDKIVFNFIPSVYDLLVTLAKTSILSQSDIINMADRIYKFLAIFMVFKVTLSLITYVVNPDDFSDKTKGLSKLGVNIIISLALLILVPYFFNYAYQFQSIILEDNTLGTLVFGDNGNSDFFNTAGEEMAYTAMSAFFVPDSSLVELSSCISLGTVDNDGTWSFNTDCSGLNNDDELTAINDNKNLKGLTDGNEKFSLTALRNYVTGVKHHSFGLTFRNDLVVATAKDNSVFVFDYKFLISTAVGVIIILLLITFCMDIAVRSIKLAFYQLIAPIPVISYVDPKSGKDGLFKKWYQACFKTYISLFVRLLALYFALYVISLVSDGKLVDVVSGAYTGGILLTVFIIIGALMFAKQLPKILEGLGIKLDGEGFTLNPLKKFEKEALGGKRFTGMAGGMVAGLAGGRGFGRIGNMLTGGVRGFAGGKGYKGGLDSQADVNRKLRQARINGAGFFGSRAAAVASRYGLDDANLESKSTKLRKNKKSYDDANAQVEAQVKNHQRRKKEKEDEIALSKRQASGRSKVASASKAVLDKAKDNIRNNKAGKFSQEYTARKTVEGMFSSERLGQKVEGDTDIHYFDGQSWQVRRVTDGSKVTQELVNLASGSAEAYLAKGKDVKTYFAEIAKGDKDADFDKLMTEYRTEASSAGLEAQDGYDAIKNQGEDATKAAATISSEIRKVEDEITAIDDEIRKTQLAATVDIDGKLVSLDEAKEIIDKEETELKTEQERRKANRDSATASRISGGSK